MIEFMCFTRPNQIEKCREKIIRNTRIRNGLKSLKVLRYKFNAYMNKEYAKQRVRSSLFVYAKESSCVRVESERRRKMLEKKFSVI